MNHWRRPDELDNWDRNEPIMVIVETNNGPNHYLCTIDSEGSLVDLDYGEDLGWEYDSIDRWCPLDEVLNLLEGV